MNVAELKLKIFREVDSLEKNRLEDIYGLLLNYINGQKDVNEWEKLTPEQRQGIHEAIDEIDSGAGIAHEKVMTKIRKRFYND